MQLITPADAGSRVTAALKSAAEATGASFDYLLQTAKRESSLNASAQAPTSSARGLFQFIDQTWLQVLKEDGPSLGFADEAADVTRTSSGKYVVSDPKRRAELLSLRDDPKASALLAGAYTQRNADSLQSALGREATSGELYAAHFLGAKGAVQLVSLAYAAPEATAASAFPAQASANRAIFYDRGRALSASEVYAKITSAHEAAAAVSSVNASTSTLALQTQEEADTVRYNNGVENDSEPFHSLFKTGRRSPVSAYIAQTWSAFGDAGGTDVASATAGSTATIAAAAAVPATAPTFNGATAFTTRRADKATTVTSMDATPLESATYRRAELALPTISTAPNSTPSRIARR